MGSQAALAVSTEGTVGEHKGFLKADGSSLEASTPVDQPDVDPGTELVHQTHTRNKDVQVNPDVNCGLWGMMMCQHKFISCNKCTILVGSIDGGETVCMQEGRGYVGTLCTFCSVLL